MVSIGVDARDHLPKDAEDNGVENPEDEEDEDEDEDERDMGSESEDDEFDNSEDVEPTTESAVAWLSSLPKDQKILREPARPKGLLHLGLKCLGPGRVVDGLVLASPGYIRLYSRSRRPPRRHQGRPTRSLGLLGVIVIVIAQAFLDKVKEIIEAAKEILDDVKEVVEAAKEVASTSENEQWNQGGVSDYAEKNE
ncbi:hypothetical protein N7501_002020 [Penicillium viridicatum]|nr:hypothetical protein N7501_002020 [Penicillium viridicatum]